MKKLLPLLLVLCMLVGLLPMAALADTAKKATISIESFTKVTVTEGGAAVYYKNSEYDMYDAEGNVMSTKAYKQVKSDENDWNLKVEWPTGGIVTVTLKNAKIVNAVNGSSGYWPSTNEDGEIEYKSKKLGAIIPTKDTEMMDIKVVLEGDNFIDCSYGVIRGQVNNNFRNIIVEGKNGGKLSGAGGQIGIHTAKGDLTFINAEVELYNEKAGGGPVPIKSKNNITIQGGHIKATNTVNVAVSVETGNLTITDGKLTATSELSATVENNAAVNVKSGTITVNGNSELNINGICEPGMLAKDIVINGGYVKVTSPLTNGISASPGNVTINGGTVEVSATKAFNRAPILADNIGGVAGASADEADYYDETKFNQKYVKLTVGGQKPPAPTTPPTTPPTAAPTTPPTAAPTSATAAPTSATAAPTGSTTAPTGATVAPTDGTTAPTSATAAPTSATAAPTAAPTNAPTKAPTSGTTTPSTEKDAQKDGGSSAVIWIVIAVVVVAAGVAAAVIVIKKKKTAQ